jgi:mono/diheme cytochrome c family protein
MARLLGALVGLVALLPQTVDGQGRAEAPKVTAVEYEGWRQYSVHCARCHGQDVLPNPVAADLLVSLAPGGPVASLERFHAVVTEGRPERGMPSFRAALTPEQTRAIHAYVAGRAAKRIPPGRPAAPAT